MPGDARRSFGVVGLPQVVPHRVTLPPTKLALQRREELGAKRLAAPAFADELVLDRVERVDVVAGEGRRGRGGRGKVGVDPLQVDVDVVQYGAALGAVGDQHAGLPGDLAFGLGGGREAGEAADQLDRAVTGR